jgi:hypothetical protein
MGLLSKVPDLKLVVGTTDLSNNVTSLRVSWPWGGKASIHGTVMEYNGSTHQILTYPTSMFDQDVLSQVFSHYTFPELVVPPVPPTLNPVPTKPNPGNIIHVSITIEGMSTSLPLFLTKSPKSDGLVVTFSGDDFIDLLSLENQDMPDITRTLNPQTAQTAINFICATYGINTVKYNWPDYPIHELHRTAGVPMNWVDQLGRVYQASRVFRGATLYMTSLGGDCHIDTAGAIGSISGILPNPQQQKWTLQDYTFLEKVDVDFADPPKNRFTVGRTQNNNIIGQADCTGGQCVGRTLNVSFSSHVTAITPHVNKCLQGSMIDFVYFDVNDLPTNATAPSNGPVLATTPIARVEATYIPAFTQAGNSTTVGAPGGYLVGGLGDYGYDVTFTGGADASSSDTIFAVTAHHYGASGQYGDIREFTPIIDSVIPNSIVATDFVNCVCYESVRKTYWCTVSTPFINTAMCPGDQVILLDEATNQTSTTWKWFVEQVDFVMSGRDEWHMELKLTIGPGNWDQTPAAGGGL